MRSRLARLAALVGVVFLLDQAIKLWIVAVLPLGRSLAVTSFFNLVHVQNRGVAFGLGAWASRWFFIALSSIAAIILSVWALRTRDEDRDLRLALGLAAGGALGNLLDRIRLGAVIDFLDFHWAGWHYPAFNLADAALSLSLAFLGLRLILARRTGAQES